ncbi:MAG: hypothetical protein ACRDTR_03745 [Rubrobacter sp.]
MSETVERVRADVTNVLVIGPGAAGLRTVRDASDAQKRRCRRGRR